MRARALAASLARRLGSGGWSVLPQIAALAGAAGSCRGVASVVAAAVQQPWCQAVLQAQQPPPGMLPRLAQRLLPGAQQHQQQQQPYRQLAPLVAVRGLLGVVRHVNYQDHNTKKPPKVKIRPPSVAKRRVLVGEDGTMWRMQAGRRHKRYKKGRRRLLDLKGMVPLHSADARKLRKLGYKKTWWSSLKA